MSRAASTWGPSLGSIRAARIPARRVGCSRCHSTSAAAPTVPARLRFAPSPTGHLHLGGLRTALFNYLLARKWDGKFLLRIEDTDQARLVDGAADALRETLEWAGIDYDEGFGAGGSFGPYVQSERLDMYQHYAKLLVEEGKAYECFCSAVDRVAIRKSMRQSGQTPGYDGRCRHLSRDDVRDKKAAGQPFTIRFKTEAEHEQLPPDLIFGQAKPMTVQTGADDFVILKSDGFPTYHLASVVDDHLMEISHVLRGEEWLPSVTKHHQLYRAFGWSPPQFAHLPLLANPDGTKLSKRMGDVHVQSYRTSGYEPEALINYVGLMGWDYHTAIESTADAKNEALPYHQRTDDNSMFDVFTMSQLIGAFDLSLVTHRRAAVNPSKLDFLNKMTLRRKAGRLNQEDGALVESGKRSPTDLSAQASERSALLERYQQSLQDQKVLVDCDLVNDTSYISRVFDAELPRTTKLPEMAMSSIFYYLDPIYTNLEPEQFLATLKLTRYIDGVTALIEELSKPSYVKSWNEDAAWEAIHAVLPQLGFKKKTELMSPLRHALTGRKSGPSVAQIMDVLGYERSIARLRGGLRFVVARARE